jgi:hypothetical protein
MKDAVPIEPEHLCIKCGTTGLGDEMHIFLSSGGDPDGSGCHKIWVHHKCYGQHAVRETRLMQGLAKLGGFDPLAQFRQFQRRA